MGIALATKGIIGGFMGGGGGDIVYVDVPICEPSLYTGEFGELVVRAVDLSPTPLPQPDYGQELKPTRISIIEILPNRNLNSFPLPRNL